MSDTAEIINWHLTEEGWLEGSKEEFLSNLRDYTVPPPASRLETYEVSYEVDAIYATPVGAVAERVWSTIDEEKRKALFEKYPPPWRGYGSWYLEK